MQRIPPFNGIFDDRQINRANKRYDRCSTGRKPFIFNGTVNGDQAQINKQQNQNGGQARIPYPISTPRRAAPKRARYEAKCGESSTDWQSGFTGTSASG